MLERPKRLAQEGRAIEGFIRAVQCKQAIYERLCRCNGIRQSWFIQYPVDALYQPPEQLQDDVVFLPKQVMDRGIDTSDLWRQLTNGERIKALGRDQLPRVFQNLLLAEFLVYLPGSMPRSGRFTGHVRLSDGADIIFYAK